MNWSRITHFFVSAILHPERVDTSHTEFAARNPNHAYRYRSPVLQRIHFCRLKVAPPTLDVKHTIFTGQSVWATGNRIVYFGAGDVIDFAIRIVTPGCY